MISVKIVPAEQVRVQVDSLRGPRGEDGYTPQIAVERVEDGVKITARNREAEESAMLYDGRDAQGGGAALDVINDEEVLGELAQSDLLLAVGSEGGVLCDEEGNVLEW